MSFSTWLTGLVLAAAVIPPLLLLYFLKLRRKPQPIACTLLWRRAVEDMQANAPFQRLRKNLLLFLQLLVLLLLAAAVAQPRLHRGTGATGKIIMIIDNSASMLASDLPETESRLTYAVEQAKDRIRTLYGGGILSKSPGETMIIAFSDRAEVMCRFTTSSQQLLAALERIRPTHAETRIAQAFKLARAYTTNVDPDNPDRTAPDPAVIELYSDGRITDLPEQVLRGGERLLYYAIGTDRPDNVAMTNLSIERPYDRPTAVQVFASLANFSTEARTCDLQLSVDGVPIAIESVDVGAAEVDPTGRLVAARNTVLFSPFELPRGATIEVRNLREDHLAADNTTQLVVAPPKRLRVLVDSSRSDLMELALEGQSLEALDRLGGAAQFSELVESARLDQYDVVVLDGIVPETLPDGRYLIFGAPPPIEGLNPFGEGEHQVVLEWRDDHPTMRYVSLDNLYIARFHKIQPADEVAVLAEGSTSPLIVSISRGPMQVIYVPFSPLDSNWPFHRSFVHFLLNSIETLGHAGEGIAARGFRPGQALSTRLPADARDIVLTLPGGETVPQTPLDPAQWSWGPARRSGIYTLSWESASGEAARSFAVNLLSGTEGDIQIRQNLDVGQEIIETLDAGESSYTALWPWVVGTCLFLLMFEWWVYHRRTII